MACDATTLLAEGACYSCLSEKQMAIAELALLCQLAGGGTAFGIQSGSVDPNGVVSGSLRQLYVQVNGTISIIWTNVDGGTTWVTQ